MHNTFNMFSATREWCVTRKLFPFDRNKLVDSSHQKKKKMHTKLFNLKGRLFHLQTNENKHHFTPNQKKKKMKHTHAQTTTWKGNRVEKKEIISHWKYRTRISCTCFRLFHYFRIYLLHTRKKKNNSERERVKCMKLENEPFAHNILLLDFVVFHFNRNRFGLQQQQRAEKKLKLK